MDECTGCGLIATFFLHYYFGTSIYELVWTYAPPAIPLLIGIPLAFVVMQLATCSPVENWARNHRQTRYLAAINA